ncbi:MAG: endonuclease/exonuclease/phosphatase family protein [Desulfobacterales bacterium]|nr:endonuclease/exonuclease/phosphatase family protein [Desulfobacterales bacterium]
MNYKRIRITLFFICFFSIFQSDSWSIDLIVANYNVENLFDMSSDGTEYDEYVPNSWHGWSKKMLRIKIQNIGKVLLDMDADVVALQEIESRNVLLMLVQYLKEQHLDYPYIDIADQSRTSVKCAMISKFPIINREEIQPPVYGARNILRITLDIGGHPFILFINHWKSKNKAESFRIAYAKTLKQQIDRVSDKDDFIIMGDLNSNYDEYVTFKKNRKLNDSNEITGINHILKTVKEGYGLVDEDLLIKQPSNEYLYNLWLEIPKKQRWSHLFFQQKDSLDHIIISKSLYDNNGMKYSDNSFYRFMPDYLFHQRRIYRWQLGKNGKHIGEGYSDHLPIAAKFSTLR